MSARDFSYVLGFVLLVVTVFSPLNQKPRVKYLSQGNNWQHSRIMCDEGPFPETQVANPWSQHRGAGCNSVSVRRLVWLCPLGNLLCSRPPQWRGVFSSHLPVPDDSFTS